ncbi:hypothetical protein [Haloplanus sp.]|uniref:hypothetical protein n=1 Tax=Haloplanus sp. TaxID=1961696 RepID=UPI002616D41A|nr:hypothetical protein [Haloplanus sp.]
MGGTNLTDAELSTDKCPERPGGPGPESHGVERVEDPDDLDAFFVSRCVWCDSVFERYDTERDYLDAMQGATNE